MIDMENIPTLPAIRVIPYGVHSSEYNMAVDEFLLGQTAPILRFYGWKKPTLSFGKSNCRQGTLDLDYCLKNNFDFIKRLTGGKTVLHHQELTYSFISNSEQFTSSILETYRLISQPLANSFELFELETDMKETEKNRSKGTNCFSEVSSYELTVGGKKLVGSAQYRRRNLLLQHGSILLDIDRKMWNKTWSLPENSNALDERITCMKDHLNFIPSEEDLCEGIIQKFCEFFKTTAYEKEITPEEEKEILALKEKYKWQGFKK